jgi:HK97 family phage major capsid protein
MTVTQINELRAQRAKHIEEARKILDAAKDREMNTEERAKYDAAHNAAKTLKTRIDDEERQAGLEEEVRGQKREARPPVGDGIDPEARGDDVPGGTEVDLRADTEEARALSRIFSEIRGRVDAEDRLMHRGEALRELRKGKRGLAAYRSIFNQVLRGNITGSEARAELRTMQADSNVDGGYMLAPAQMVSQLIKDLDNAVFIRGFATRFACGHSGLGAVSLNTDLDDFGWTTELSSGNQDDALKLGKRELKPHPLAKKVLFSKTLAANAPDAISLLTQRLVYKLGITQEKAYLTGNGAGQPLGVFTASTDGIPTTRDVSTDNTTTAITADGLLNAKYSLKAEHRRAARWMFHRDGLLKVAKLKDGENQYLWQPGLIAGQPDRLLNLPVDESEYVPNTFTAGNYVGILANWQYYWIADSLDLALQVLVELYAGSNKNGIHARYEGDGLPVLAEAFARVKLADA